MSKKRRITTHTENPSEFAILKPSICWASGGVVLPYRKHLFTVWLFKRGIDRSFCPMFVGIMASESLATLGVSSATLDSWVQIV